MTKTKTVAGPAPVRVREREKGERRSTYFQRREWLEVHAKELEGMTHNQIVRKMKKVGLLAPTTAERDVSLPPEWKIKTDEVEQAIDKAFKEMLKRPVR